MSYFVNLDYFKPNGTWYTDGTYTSEQREMFEIHAEIRQMVAENTLLGLSVLPNERFIISVDVPNHPNRHPRLIFTELL